MRINGETLAAVRREVGHVEAMDATQFGDAERMYIVTSPKCAYCGSYKGDDRCVKCGAGASQYPAWRG